MASSINASTAGAGGVITTADNSGVLQVQTAGTTALTISAAQAATFANSITLTSGGITFNANPGGGTQATLNDYEVGTCTPTTSGVTTSSTSGSYVKIGRTVWIYMSLSISSGSSAFFTVTNLPFTASAYDRQVLLARENGVTGKTGQFAVTISSTSGFVQDYAGVNGGTSGYVWLVTGTYQSAS